MIAVAPGKDKDIHYRLGRSGASENGEETEVTKEEEEQRASAALYALKRRYRTSQELERNLRDAYSALVDCEDECFTDILLHITHSGRLLEEGAETLDTLFDVSWATSGLEEFVEDPNGYKARYREGEEEMERDENDPSLAAPVKPELLPDATSAVNKVWYFIFIVLAVLVAGGIVCFSKPATHSTPASSSPNAAASANQEDGTGQSGTTGQTLHYTVYRNSKFGYTFKYPEAFLIPQPESMSGARRTFSSRDGSAKLTCWGAVLPDGSDIQTMYQNDLRGFTGITYKVRRPNWYVISGIENHEIYYAKTIIGHDSYASFLIDVPQSEKKTYAPIIARISRSFVFSEEPQSAAVAKQIESDQREAPPLGFRGLHAGQSRAEIESALRAQNLTMTCKAPDRDGSVDCKCDLLVCNFAFSPEDKLWHFDMMLGIITPISPQPIYNEIASVLGPGTSMNESGKKFEWDRGGSVPCPLDPGKDCPSQRLTLTMLSEGADVKFQDNGYLAKSQGITKPNPNRPRPKVNKTFVLFGLKGGEPQADAETTLRKSGYSTPACKYDSASLTNKCETTNGTDKLSVEFFQNRLVTFNLDFPKSEWERQVQLFEGTLGNPTDRQKRKTALGLSWQSEQTIPCVGEADKQCTAETLTLSIDNQDATGRALYLYMPLENEIIVEQARRMTQGQ